ncbi:hypothetical protein [Sinimarinibacterium sp. NLF-5-8]|uniref:hypothetical protein n=1 Tax=Sinimarinibacterium sp. NLF-5-8 TaxID=2698684 RepID=UPI00137BEE7C|nr:hypothetical protein [Sinimarinibacterium sp. NLF-5-8]QHS10676.1 hypothetical protein GT972_11365 [Sinimarinibacterium sp. NLF-5-8]
MNDSTDTSNATEPAIGERISYHKFGENFIRYLVTIPRLSAELEGALKQTIEGSAAALPNELLVAGYQFRPKAMDIIPRDMPEGETGFCLEVGARLDLTLKVMTVPIKVPMKVQINVDIDVHTLHPLTIQIHPQPVRGRNVDVQIMMPKELRALPTHLIDKINPLVLAVRESLAREVNTQIRRPDLAEMCTIDVLALAEKALNA